VKDNDVTLDSWETTENTRGFMHDLNEASYAFIDFAPTAPGPVIDMGCAFGVATLPTLATGATVIACDLEPSHLDEVQKRTPSDQTSRLTTQQGLFPQDFDFESNSIGAILCSHLLNFLPPDDMEAACAKMFDWLAPGGKIFAESYTHFNKLLCGATPDVAARKAAGDRYPTWIEFGQYAGVDHPITLALQKHMNMFDLDTLSGAFTRAGLGIEKAEYIDCTGKADFMQDTLLDGREWYNIIGTKS
jgi:predicted SAM-dependent methyltransferase